jgi:hypothetical protein
MKKIALLASAFVFTLSVMAQNHVDSIVKMKEDTHNFGKIKQGIPATTYFEFKNISNKPVVVQVATAGCGCTRPEWDSLPVPPGGMSKIKVGYNAAAQGAFTKDVYITFAGIPEQKTIHITGEVLPADQYDTWIKDNPPAPEKKTDKTKSKN